MTATTRTEHPWPAAVILEGWRRTVLAVRELAADVDPTRLRDPERAALLALVPGMAEQDAVREFTAYAEAEQELAAIDPDDYSTATAVRRGDLGDECANRIGELLRFHPYSPAWPTTEQSHPDTVTVAEALTRAREEVREADRRRSALRQRVADLEAANGSLEQLVDAYRPSVRAQYTLTAAGISATGGADVLELPLGGAR